MADKRTINDLLAEWSGVNESNALTNLYKKVVAGISVDSDKEFESHVYDAMHHGDIKTLQSLPVNYAVHMSVRASAEAGVDIEDYDLRGWVEGYTKNMKDILSKDKKGRELLPKVMSGLEKL